MAEPVVHLELNPRRGEQIEGWGWDELAPGEQLLGHHARIRVEQFRFRLGIRVGERDVSAEAGPEAPHRRVADVVPPARERADVQVGRPRRRRLDEPRVRKVALPKLVAQADQRQDRERSRQPGPANPPIDSRGERNEKACEDH
jgi:hypothetical protein